MCYVRMSEEKIDYKFKVIISFGLCHLLSTIGAITWLSKRIMIMM